MVAGDERDDFDLARLEPAQVSVLDQVIRMLVVTIVADVHADIVQQRRVLEPFAFAIAELMCLAHAVEERASELRDLLRMLRQIVAPLGQLDHASTPHVRIPVDLVDVRRVLLDVVEHQTLAQREVAQRDLVDVQRVEQRIEQDDAGRREVRAARFEARQLQPLLERLRDQQLAQSVNVPRLDAQIAEVGGPGRPAASVPSVRIVPEVPITRSKRLR